MARTWNDQLPEHVRKALVKVKLIDSDATGPDWDQWDGYPQERREIIRFIGELVTPNVVVLSGDVHVGMASELAGDADMPPVAAEFVNTSLTSQNLDDKMGWALRTDSVAIERAIVEGLPHVHYLDLDSHGYGLVDLDRERLRFEWWTTGLGPDDRDQVRSHAMQMRRGETRPEAAPAG